ncbi:hypothetical protein JAAARDRAFT_474125 [Jaapia argillacea MUCL 33604]|uniref:DUF6533 domain-containing protein n=1 Tax=Jaapia argillacea MUCL 33604 TaxID=933084 RepID=A0A067PN09_9AGAM|nr:hypothetical protein JAAARDRAFT_474125 [Jaapia argillacea MUCL 33604]
MSGENVTFIAREALVVSYSSIASLTVVTWDIIITFDEEVKYIWRQRRGSPTKWLFLFTRYFSLVCQMMISLRSLGVFGTFRHSSESVCRSWFFFENFTLQILIGTVESILTLRVYALYGRSRPIRIVLISLFVLQIIVFVPIFAFITPKIGFDEDCIPVTTKLGLRALHLLTASSLSTQLVLFILALTKSVNTIREGKGRIPIAVVIARDSLWVFCLVTAMLLINGAFYTILNTLFRALIFTWILSSLSFSSCRLVLNLSRLGAQGEERSTEDAFTSNLTIGTEMRELYLTSAGDPEFRSSVLRMASESPW